MQGWGVWVMQGWGGVGEIRCYSYLSQMQNDANCCDMSIHKVLVGVRWVMKGGVGHTGFGGS